MKVVPTIPSPLQTLGVINGVELTLKRDDLIHPQVSGNKWRKLKYYLQDFREGKKEVMLSFGGAYSNHIAALAALGKMEGIPTKALVRGEEVKFNPTLDFCRSQGMEIESISRQDYAERDNPEFLRSITEHLPEVYLISEGGKGPLGVKGCTEILHEVEGNFDFICCAAGTGTTVAGLLLSESDTKIMCFPALKGGKFLGPAIERWLLDYQWRFSTSIAEKVIMETYLKIVDNYHFGGYARTTNELIDFMNQFHENYQVPLDPVYTGKMMFGIFDLIQSGVIPEGAKVLALHTGGLQGIKGMNQRLKATGNKLLNYEN